MKVKRFLFVFIVLALVFAASQPVLSAQAQQGPAPLVGADAARAIAGRYIVVFHDDVPQEVVDRVLSRVASEPDVVVHYVYQEALRGFAADLPPRAGICAGGAFCQLRRSRPGSQLGCHPEPGDLGHRPHRPACFTALELVYLFQHRCRRESLYR